jgi:hypothetical protein
MLNVRSILLSSVASICLSSAVFASGVPEAADPLAAPIMVPVAQDEVVVAPDEVVVAPDEVVVAQDEEVVVEDAQPVHFDPIIYEQANVEPIVAAYNKLLTVVPAPCKPRLLEFIDTVAELNKHLYLTHFHCNVNNTPADFRERMVDVLIRANLAYDDMLAITVALCAHASGQARLDHVIGKYPHAAAPKVTTREKLKNAEVAMRPVFNEVEDAAKKAAREIQHGKNKAKASIKKKTGIKL